MSPEERAALEARLITLRRWAKTRRNEPGFEINVPEIDAAIADIEAQLAAADQP